MRTRVYEEVNVKSLSAEQVQSITKTRWVIEERSGPTGEVSIKARIVGKGYTQSMIPESVYAGTPHMSSLKILLVLACKNNWVIATSDINEAFLHAPLTEEAHVTPPPQYIHQTLSQELCGDSSLKCALYGLRQAPKAWQHHLTQVVIHGPDSAEIRQLQLKKKFDLKHASFSVGPPGLGQSFFTSLITRIGKLLWLSAIRPDIRFSVKELSRKLNAPSINDSMMRRLSGI
eukprot:2752827-Amphidinium_carterae.6